VVFSGGSVPITAAGCMCPEPSTTSDSDPLGRCQLAAAGLYFVGVHFLRSRKSSLLYGVGEDAAIVADRIAQHRSA